MCDFVTHIVYIVRQLLCIVLSLKCHIGWLKVRASTEVTRKNISLLFDDGIYLYTKNEKYEPSYFPVIEDTPYTYDYIYIQENNV